MNQYLPKGDDEAATKIAALHPIKTSSVLQNQQREKKNQTRKNDSDKSAALFQVFQNASDSNAALVIKSRVINHQDHIN